MKYTTFYKLIFLILFNLIYLSCAKIDDEENNNIKTSIVKIGQEFKHELIKENINSVDISILDKKYDLIYKPDYILIDNKLIIKRILENINIFKENNELYNENSFDYILKIKIDDLIVYYRLKIEKSLFVKSLCSSVNCESKTGYAINNLPVTLKVKSTGFVFNKIVYNILYNEKSFEYVHEFNSFTNEDILENIKFEKVKEDMNEYIVSINIKAFNESEYFETIYPVVVVRPLQIKHDGKTKLAQIFEPVPVTGCIPGAIGNRVEYSETQSETRQNSITISLEKSFSTSDSNSISVENSEAFNISESISESISVSQSDSETFSESESNSSTSIESNDFSFSTSDGENWSWTINNTEDQSTISTNGAGVNASVETTVSGEGSLPFIAKASGSLSTSVGGNINWSNSETNGNSSSRGYISSQSSDKQTQYGSSATLQKGHELSGSYAYNITNLNSLENGTSISSGRVWNMSENISTGNVSTNANSESLQNTIINSSTSSTTFSYNAYIPRGKYGVFFRQTSRFVKLSEIIKYDIDGNKSIIGYIYMNSWNWAPELVTGESCEQAYNYTFEESECYIEPCF